MGCIKVQVQVGIPSQSCEVEDKAMSRDRALESHS